MVGQRDVDGFHLRVGEKLRIRADTHLVLERADELAATIRLTPYRDEFDAVGAHDRRDHDLARDVRRAQDAHSQRGHNSILCGARPAAVEHVADRPLTCDLARRDRAALGASLESLARLSRAWPALDRAGAGQAI